MSRNAFFFSLFLTFFYTFASSLCARSLEEKIILAPEPPHFKHRDRVCRDSAYKFRQWLDEMNLTANGREILMNLYNMPKNLKKCRGNWGILESFIEDRRFTGLHPKPIIEDRRSVYRYSQQPRPWRSEEKSYHNNYIRN